MERPIAYEPHPVSPERKAELISKGYRIIDARFAPADAKPVVTEVVTPEPEPQPIPPAIEDYEEVAAFIDDAFDDMVEEVAEVEKPRRGRKKKVAD